MFWNTEFLDASPSHIDVLLQMPTVKLSDILFEDDLLQELKTSNSNLINFLNRTETITELVDNITLLTEKDCCDKLVYSKVHAAYISCEILSSGSPDIFAHLVNRPDCLTKIISCLTIEPKPYNNTNNNSGQADNATEQPASDQKVNEIEEQKEADEEENEINEDEDHSGASDAKGPEQEPDVVKIENSTNDNQNDHSSDLSISEHVATKVVPQKANLVSKVISTVHMVAPALLSCHISRNIDMFSRLIDLLVDNIDVSGSFEILCTFIKPTGMEYQSIECRYHFCEILGKLHFVDKLIDVMTNSDSDDKQRNACQLLCDIIVLGRQCAADQKDQPVSFDLLTELLQSKDRVQTILEQMFSREDRNSTAIICGMKVLQVLIEKKVVADGPMVVIAIGEAQEAIEKYLIHFHELLLNPPKQEPIKTTFGIIQKPLGYIRLEVVNLIRALISTNSPFVIKKLVELATMKVIIDLFIEYSWNNLLHTQVEQALCLIINNYRKDEESNYQTQIVEMHTQHIIDNHQSNQNSTENLPETEKQKESQQQQESTQSKLEQPATEFPSRALLSQILNECDLIGRLLLPNSVTNNNISGTIIKEHDNESNNKENSSSVDNCNSNNIDSSSPKHDGELNNKEDTSTENAGELNNKDNLSPVDAAEVKTKENSSSVHDGNSKNIPLSNGIDNSDKPRRVELERQRRKNGEQANFGHIIQMINSIAINRDLDTIRDHLNEMKDTRPDLHDRWTTFVNVDVASFKEISLFYDAQSANNNVNHRFGHNNQMSNNQHLMESAISNLSHMNSPTDNENSRNNNDEGQFYAYFSFTKEVVLPDINVDVLPKMRRLRNAPSSDSPVLSERDLRYALKQRDLMNLKK